MALLTTNNKTMLSYRGFERRVTISRGNILTRELQIGFCIKYTFWSHYTVAQVKNNDVITPAKQLPPVSPILLNSPLVAWLFTSKTLITCSLEVVVCCVSHLAIFNTNPCSLIPLWVRGAFHFECRINFDKFGLFSLKIRFTRVLEFKINGNCFDISNILTYPFRFNSQRFT